MAKVMTKAALLEHIVMSVSWATIFLTLVTAQSTLVSDVLQSALACRLSNAHMAVGFVLSGLSEAGSQSCCRALCLDDLKWPQCNLTTR